MGKFFDMSDGVHESRRPVQDQALKFLDDVWSKDTKDIAISAPVGSGKSLIARIAQKVTNAAIITPSNLLVNQYTSTYAPELNYLIGGEHYQCAKSGCACPVRIHEDKYPPCTGCPYIASNARAKAGEHTVFNPLSMWFLQRRNPNYIPPRVSIVDEAHTVLEMIRGMCMKSFAVKKGEVAQCLTNEIFFVAWLEAKRKEITIQASIAAKVKDHDKAAKLDQEAAGIALIILGVKEAPQAFAIWQEERQHGNQVRYYMQLRPLYLPKIIVRTIIGEGRIILMSGSLFSPDIVELLGTDAYHYLDLPSPIPIANRQILYRPFDYKINMETDPARMAADILKEIGRYPGNTIIHVPYSWQTKLQPHLPASVFCHDKDSKSETLDLFKVAGGILLASGMSEGLDLKGDLCSTNIIPKLLYPNLGDTYIQKRKGLQDGETWYALQTLKHVVQAAGRSTRSETDKSTIIVKDPTFPYLVAKTKKYAPQSFLESIVWSSNDTGTKPRR